MRSANVKKGDIFRLPAGTVFFAQSSLESERQKLRVYAIFANSINDLREPSTPPYTSISDLVLGFDIDVLQAAFQVPESVIEEILNGAKQPAIIHGQKETEQTMWDKEMEYVKQLVGNRGSIKSFLSKKKKKDKDDDDDKMYNIMEEDADFENCNGWSSTVTSKHLDALKGSEFGVFMVNLTRGSMMGPHWNPVATEVAIVLEGQGMIRVVCPKTIANVAECRNMRFHVKEGDAFVVPRFHPMAQMAFNNDSFVFMGFSTSAKNNNPQFLAGKASVFRTLSVDVVAASFNVPNTTITQLLGAQDESVILECVSCAEEELRIMKGEMEREMEERRKREEEEGEGKQEREEAREREEEKARREEEERKQRQEEEEEGGADWRKEREAKKRREGETTEEEQERARRAEEQARRASKERDRRASEESRRAAEEELERERRQWEPQEGRGGREDPGRRQRECQGARGGREEGGRGKWDEGRSRSLKRLTI